MHTTRPGIIPRLKRAEGHLRSIITMLEEGKPCLHLAQQLHAVVTAIARAKKELIHDHIEHCLEGDGGITVKAALAELKLFAKYL